MSFTKILFFTCLLVVNANPLTQEEQEALYRDLMLNCKAQEGASDADVQELISHKPLSTRSGQCMHACVMENIGFIQNGKLSLEGCVKIAKMIGDAARVENVELVTKECLSTVGADRCDLAVQIIQCISKVAVANGIDLAKDLL